ncbi:DeoR family transcriptional regulator [Sinomonas cellulolyticus]|jgi:DeoR/GlpR family transcriptional regulator of sugar metabolism|uniref:DeoR/GlpR transcriptional regulator n=1 Tax=Sinomonas cellulolyticus TaxID=2801916 RepID=A0ABS1JYI0_9MICC|nr:MULTISPECIES: DeoR/GlpR family DNA-binding transcription regulator [Sinomonas]MBL0704461.1 DeoR/GlpR transcriptional regulator [Sinomonas cellulolyticus]GHG48806.1 DeoR family transcriptional regulator [Sinomonas sp. KCTC 49339]
MLAAERQAYIVAELERREAVRVTELAAALGVSEMTIRRDIEQLELQGLARRVHGGAARPTEVGFAELGFAAKSEHRPDAKGAIAARALELVRPGATIFVTAGTTTFTFAQLLATVPDLTVATNSIKVAEALGDASNGSVRTILTGGERTPSEALVGPLATSTLRQLHVETCFMGVHGLHPRAGLTTPNMLEAETNRAAAESAARLVVLADHSKYGLVSLARILPLSAVDTLITDDALSTSALEELRQNVPDLVVAAVGESRSA